MRTTIRLNNSRRGAALPLMIGAIVIIGGLIAGAFFAATQEFRIGRNTVTLARAASAAEMGVGMLVRDWDPAWNRKLAKGDTLQRTYAFGGTTCNVTVTRVDGPFFWVVSEAWAGGRTAETGARRRVGTFLRLDTPEMKILGALTGRGTLKIGGSAMVDGRDEYKPSGWNCPATSSVVPGVAMSDTVAGLTMPGCTVTKNCVEGTPKFVQTLEAADTATYFQYGNSSYAELAASANIVVPPTATFNSVNPVAGLLGSCDKSVMTNWGEPKRGTPNPPCWDYMPTVHVQGSVQLSNGRGQGILLVDGDLTMAGNFYWLGPVIVRGTLKAYGGSYVLGYVAAANIDLDDTSTILGNSGIFYSSCVLNTIFQANAKVVPAKGRAWTTMF
jgi:hypothetical protein